MPDDPNQIGKVSVGVTATGVEETTKKLDQVAAHAKQAQAAINGAGGGVAGSIGAASGVAGGDVGADAAASAAGKASAPFGGLRQELRQIFGIISGITAAGFVFEKLITGAIAFKNAAHEVSQELRNIEEGLKINTTVGKTGFETLLDSANEYHKKVKDNLEEESESGKELLREFVENSRARVSFEDGMVKIQIDDSNELTAKKLQNEKTLQANKEKLIALEMNSADLEIRNLDRRTQMENALTEVEKIKLERKFAAEDRERARAAIVKTFDEQTDKDEIAKVNKKYDELNKADADYFDKKQARQQRIFNEEQRQFQAQAARSAASRFGPGNTDLNTLILKNIEGALRAYAQTSRRF